MYGLDKKGTWKRGKCHMHLENHLMDVGDHLW